MRKLNRNLPLVIALLGSTLFFQNCARGFNPASGAAQSATSDSSTSTSSGQASNASSGNVPVVVVAPVTNGGVSSTTPVVASKGCAQSLMNLDKRNLRIASVAAPTTCLSVLGEGAGSSLIKSDCKGEWDLFYLNLQPTCDFKIQRAPKLVYNPQLGADIVANDTCLLIDGGALKTGACARGALWTVSATANGAIVKSADGNCLKIAAAGGAASTCAANDEQNIVFKDADDPAAFSLALKTPISFDYYDSQGPGIKLENLDSVTGYRSFTLPQQNNAKAIELEKADAEFEFTFTAPDAGTYVLGAVYAGVYATSFAVYQDGVAKGHLLLRATGSLDLNQHSGAISLAFEKGKASKLRFVTVGTTAPIRLFNLQFSPPIKIPIPLFGLASEISSTAVTTLEPTQFSDSYRLPLSLNAAGAPIWICPWTHCYIEYKIHVSKAGMYELKFDYVTNSTAALKGKRLLLDGKYISTLNLPANTTSSASWNVQLGVGDHWFRMDHPDYDLGTLADSVTTGRIYFSPKF